jgi:hypothetical protein
MRRLVLVVTLVVASLGSGFAAKPQRLGSRPIAVAFFDANRTDQESLKDFQFFYPMIRDIAKRDFPNVEFRLLGRGELLRLPDDTGLNVANMREQLGYVLWAPGQKRRVLTGVQTDMDFACAAAAFYHRASSACPK